MCQLIQLTPNLAVEIRSQKSNVHRTKIFDMISSTLQDGKVAGDKGISELKSKQ
jgi:hypothetical protein